MASKVGEFLSGLSSKVNSFVVGLKVVVVSVLKLVVPVVIGLVVCDVVFGTAFNIIGKTVIQIQKLGFGIKDIKTVLLVAGAVSGVLWIQKK
jgi:hypothetical protein